MTFLPSYASFLYKLPVQLWFGLRELFGLDRQISSADGIRKGAFYRIVYRSGYRRHEVIVRARSGPYLRQDGLVFDWKKLYVYWQACYSAYGHANEFGSLRHLGLTDSDRYKMNKVFVTKPPPWYFSRVVKPAHHEEAGLDSELDEDLLNHAWFDDKNWQPEEAFPSRSQ